MTTDTQQILATSLASSYAGTQDFPAHVQTAAKLGIESYRVDFREHAATYYHANGAVHVVPLPGPAVAIAAAFDDQAVVAAIRAAQQGQIRLPEFVERCRRAGCVGYTVWIAGRHVVYCGRRGECHVERFPAAAT
jgi:uncharacterized protein YbcV (DUF1398 family)